LSKNGSAIEARIAAGGSSDVYRTSHHGSCSGGMRRRGSCTQEA
jgi:hypothetical protein